MGAAERTKVFSLSRDRRWNKRGWDCFSSSWRKHISVCVHFVLFFSLLFPDSSIRAAVYRNCQTKVSSCADIGGIRFVLICRRNTRPKTCDSTQFGSCCRLGLLAATSDSNSSLKKDKRQKKRSIKTTRSYPTANPRSCCLMQIQSYSPKLEPLSNKSSFI